VSRSSLASIWADTSSSVFNAHKAATISKGRNQHGHWAGMHGGGGGGGSKTVFLLLLLPLLFAFLLLYSRRRQLATKCESHCLPKGGQRGRRRRRTGLARCLSGGRPKKLKKSILSKYVFRTIESNKITSFVSKLPFFCRLVTLQFAR
jgi:hypothetical protein